MSYQRWIRILLYAFVVTFAASPSWAGPLQVIVDDLGGGVSQYNFTLVNDLGPLVIPNDEPISGLNIFRANSFFGLDFFSVIGAPQDWGAFAPSSLVDELSYFSFNLDADVPVSGSLGGFFFQSLTDPNSLPSDGLVLFRDYDLITASGIQVKPVPEPSTLVLFGTFLVVLLGYRWWWRKATV